MGPHITVTPLQLVEISARAKCSVQTTRRAYGGANISPFNRARIVDAARDLNYPAPPGAAATHALGLPPPEGTSDLAAPQRSVA